MSVCLFPSTCSAWAAARPSNSWFPYSGSNWYGWGSLSKISLVGEYWLTASESLQVKLKSMLETSEQDSLLSSIAIDENSFTTYRRPLRSLTEKHDNPRNTLWRRIYVTVSPSREFFKFENQTSNAYNFEHMQGMQKWIADSWSAPLYPLD